jgi:hypothetical protein
MSLLHSDDREPGQYVWHEARRATVPSEGIAAVRMWEAAQEVR